MMQFYRYESGMGKYGVFIWLNTYHLIRETNCYYIVSGDGYGVKEIRVPKDPAGCKRIHHTKKAAWNSFKIRQERRISHLETYMEVAKSCLEFVSTNQPIDNQCHYTENPKMNELIELLK